MQEITWKSPKAIFSDWEEDSGIKASIETSKIKKWTNDKIKSWLGNGQLTRELSLVHIEGKKGYLPNNFHSMVQAAYGFVGEHAKECTRERIVQWAGKDHITGCDIKIDIDCPKCKQKECTCPSTHVARYEVNIMDINNHPEWLEIYNGSFYKVGKMFGNKQSCGYHPDFYLMRPTSNNFFDVNHIKGCVNLKVGGDVEYDIDMPYLKMNIKKCKALISYLGYRMDEDGLLMVPDIPEVWDSLKVFIDMKLTYARWVREVDNKYERLFTQLKAYDTELNTKAILALRAPNWKKFRLNWDNFVGKRVANIYGEDTYGAYLNDSQLPY